MPRVYIWINAKDVALFHLCLKELYLYSDEKPLPVKYWIKQIHLNMLMVSVSMEDYLKMEECK